MPDDGAPPRRTFVLVHGAAHGGWCWVRVAERLRARGHRVFTPTLTGLGERSHLMSRDIDLDTHIADIVNVIRWEGLEDVALCGHSYGGWVVSGVVEQVPDRIAAIVYLDAFMPENGQRGVDLQPEETRKAVLAAAERGEASRAAGPASRYGVNEADRPWVDSLLTPQPIGVSLQPIRLTGARDRVPSKAYILARGYANPRFIAAYDALQADPSWRRFELACGHDAMIEMPDRLSEILLEVA